MSITPKILIIELENRLGLPNNNTYCHISYGYKIKVKAIILAIKYHIMIHPSY